MDDSVNLLFESSDKTNVTWTGGASIETIVFYDNGNGLAAWIAANMVTGLLDIHHLPSYDWLQSRIHSFRPSDGAMDYVGEMADSSTPVLYVGCKGQSHIVVKSCRNFLSLYQLKQSDYAFIRAPSIRFDERDWKSFTRSLYNEIAVLYPHIQAAVWSVIWTDLSFLRSRIANDRLGTHPNMSAHRHRLTGTHIVYHCYGSAHSSITSAAIHLHRLPMDRKPTIQEITSLPDYDRDETWQIGTLHFKGHDSEGAAVYTIGLGPRANTVKRALVTFLNHIGCDLEGLVMNEALVHINHVARIGGALSRRYGYVRVGRYVSAYGIQNHYDRLVSFVKGVNRFLYGDRHKS